MKLSVCPAIDKLLEGGLECGCITNFYGPSASGKSNIAFVAAASALASGKKVLFIDTEGGFSVERLRQVCNGVSQMISDKIILLEPKDWSEQKEAIKKLEALKEDAGLIVVDSITALWRLTVSDQNAQTVNNELAYQLSLLSKIAREQNIPVLITNQVYTDIDSGRIELSSKNIVKWWSKNLIELMHAGRTGCRIAIIKRARSLPEDKRIEFEICGDGLKEVKFRIF
ncbi:MAG: DNA repair and recombination protein RadB [Nanoarchaeota archaeon]|nr:DNA repair and recombination protein RadB [Nanoarchaeota archaeon]